MTDTPVTVALSQPMQAHGETVHELTFRPPTGRDFRTAGRARRPDGTDDDMWDFRLIGGCCNVPPSSIDALPMRDVLRLQAVLHGFLADTTSETSPPPTGAAPGTGDVDPTAPTT